MGVGGLGPITQEDVRKQEERDEFWRKKQQEGTIGTETIDATIDIAKTIGKQFFNPENENTQRLGRGLQTAGQVLGESWQDTREFKEWYNVPGNIAAVGARGIEAAGGVVSKYVGDPVAGTARKFGFDSRIAGTIALASEMVVTAGVAKAGSIAKTRIGDTIEGLAYGLGGTGGAGATRGTGKVLSTAARKQQLMSNLPTITTGSKEYNKIAKKAEEYARQKGNLTGFGNHYIDENGIWRAWKWNKKTEKISVLDQGGRYERGVRRLTAEQLDDKTLLKQFGGDKKLLEQYHESNRTIRRNIQQQIKKINEAGKKTHGAKWDPIELEHIHDVQFFWKLRNEVPDFAGSGANEAINLTALKKSINVKTGAEASTISGSDALIKKQFPDYNKAITEFVDFDMYNTVKNMKTSDWEGLTQLILENPNMNVHELLVNYF